MAKIPEFSGEYRFLSNFWPSPVFINNIAYSTAEHAYQAQKTLDPYERLNIAKQPTPGAAKRLGRTITVRPDWDNVKVGIMRHILICKFSDPQLATKLLATGNALLEEGNRWGDTFWGIDLRTGQGQNHLGQLLMSVRTDLYIHRGR